MSSPPQDSHPQIHRPTPRRPFSLNLTSIASPPSSDSLHTAAKTSPPLHHSSSAESSTTIPQSISVVDTPNTSNFSRTRSILNLTSSTLFGIYSPTAYSNDASTEPSTPWGTGAQTPARGSVVEQSLEESCAAVAGLKTRPQPYAPVRTSSNRGSTTEAARRKHQSVMAIVLAGLARLVALFVLGAGYGTLVTHLHDDRNVASVHVEGPLKPRYDWSYLLLWGVAGVGLGSLLPWVDRFWEQQRPSGLRMQQHSGHSKSDQTGLAGPGDDLGIEQDNGRTMLASASGLAADWSPAVRSIGAFVGIAFAIRKLPWASTLQVSLTLFLVNPVLWYLIDRSKTGFLLSAAVGAVGTTTLLALNPEMMPAPTSFSWRTSSVGYGANGGPAAVYASGGSGHMGARASEGMGVMGSGDAYWAGNGGGLGAGSELQALLGTLVAKETVECGTWIISVLFCSTVCFGNVGRRLAIAGSGWGTIKGQSTSVRA